MKYIKIKLILFRFAKALGGIIAAFGLAIAVGLGANPAIFGHSSIKWDRFILFGILGLLGLYIFIRSDQRIKELEKTDESAAKKIKQGITWTAALILIIAIIFLLWTILFKS